MHTMEVSLGGRFIPECIFSHESTPGTHCDHVRVGDMQKAAMKSYLNHLDRARGADVPQVSEVGRDWLVYTGPGHLEQAEEMADELTTMLEILAKDYPDLASKLETLAPGMVDRSAGMFYFDQIPGTTVLVCDLGPDRRPGEVDVLTARLMQGVDAIMTQQLKLP